MVPCGWSGGTHVECRWCQLFQAWHMHKVDCRPTTSLSLVKLQCLSSTRGICLGCWANNAAVPQIVRLQNAVLGASHGKVFAIIGLSSSRGILLLLEATTLLSRESKYPYRRLLEIWGSLADPCGPAASQPKAALPQELDGSVPGEARRARWNFSWQSSSLCAFCCVGAYGDKGNAQASGVALRACGPLVYE
jgi:hypothetical protein